MAFKTAQLDQTKIAGLDSLMLRWQEASNKERQQFEGTTKTFINYDIVRYTIGGKYAHLCIGSSSAFLVDLNTGIIYGNKGWLKIDKTKIVGNAFDPNFNAQALVRDRFRWGRFENAQDGTPREAVNRAGRPVAA